MSSESQPLSASRCSARSPLATCSPMTSRTARADTNALDASAAARTSATDPSISLGTVYRRFCFCNSWSTPKPFEVTADPSTPPAALVRLRARWNASALSNSRTHLPGALPPINRCTAAATRARSPLPNRSNSSLATSSSADASCVALSNALASWATRSTSPSSALSSMHSRAADCGMDSSLLSSAVRMTVGRVSSRRTTPASSQRATTASANGTSSVVSAPAARSHGK